MGGTEQEDKKKETVLSCSSWCCNVLVRNPSSRNGELLCKGTKNQERLSRWEVYLFRRRPSLTGPWVAEDSGLDEFASLVFPHPAHANRWKQQLPSIPHLSACNNNHRSAHLWPTVSIWRNFSVASCSTFKPILFGLTHSWGFGFQYASEMH